MAKKFSMDKQYDMDDAKSFLDNICDQLKVKISITEEGEFLPEMELVGSITKAELVDIIRNRKTALHAASQKDELTGLLNATYFEKRVSTIDRSEVLPVAVINFNINDWKVANDNFGDEESDRLIKIIADVIKNESKPYFVSGRINGDVFGVVIPMAVDDEAENFVKAVKDKCSNYEDYHLLPSVAAGIAYKTNIEQTIEDLMSDAEYEMFNDKYAIKNDERYQRHLNRKLERAKGNIDV